MSGLLDALLAFLLADLLAVLLTALLIDAFEGLHEIQNSALPANVVLPNVFPQPASFHFYQASEPLDQDEITQTI